MIINEVRRQHHGHHSPLVEPIQLCNERLAVLPHSVVDNSDNSHSLDSMVNSLYPSLWRLSSGTPYLGHFPTGLTAAGSSRMVASLLSLCASLRSASSGIRTASRARWHTSGTTLSPAYSSHGNGENEPTMDSGRGPLLSLAASTILSLLRALELCLLRTDVL
jgi:hypothetical protein